MSPDGRRAVSGRSDATLRLWDLETGQCLRTLEGHAGRAVEWRCEPHDEARTVSGIGTRSCASGTSEPCQPRRSRTRPGSRATGERETPTGGARSRWSQRPGVWDARNRGLPATLEGHATGRA